MFLATPPTALLTSAERVPLHYAVPKPLFEAFEHVARKLGVPPAELAARVMTCAVYEHSLLASLAASSAQPAALPAERPAVAGEAAPQFQGILDAASLDDLAARARVTL